MGAIIDRIAAKAIKWELIVLLPWLHLDAHTFPYVEHITLIDASFSRCWLAVVAYTDSYILIVSPLS